MVSEVLRGYSLLFVFMSNAALEQFLIPHKFMTSNFVDFYIPVHYCNKNNYNNRDSIKILFVILIPVLSDRRECPTVLYTLHEV